MASIGGSNVVESGLVLSLDAANARSYPGSGATWRDLSGNGNNGTLVNGPTFSSANGGSIVFDGSNDFISINYNPIITNQITCEAWINIDISNILGPVSNGWIMGRELSYRMIYNTFGITWVCRTTNNGWYSEGTSVYGTPPDSLDNKWIHVVGIYNSFFNSIYINGEFKASGSTISGNTTTTGTFYIGRSDAVGSVNYGKGRGATYRIYNRALSAQEVAQNFNATKSRFNL
jgi:hypothetical protein